MNLAEGKCCASVLLADDGAARSSRPKRSALLPRPWRRMMLCVCAVVGCTTRGSGQMVCLSFVLLILGADVGAVDASPLAVIVVVCSGFVPD